MINAKITGMLVAVFVAGSFIASPELRAFAANTVGSADIIDESIQSVDIGNGQVKTADLGGNAVTAAKIKDGEVKAAEIATDAVGADELQGVSKLIFASCPISLSNFGADSSGTTSCAVTGAQAGDRVITTLNAGSSATSRHCIVHTSSFANDGSVLVRYGNICPTVITSSFTAELIVLK